MTQTVIDVLEIIKVDHHQGQLNAVRIAGSDPLLHFGMEGVTVGNACEAVEMRRAPECLLLLGLLGNVLDDADQKLGAVLAVFDLTA